MLVSLLLCLAAWLPMPQALAAEDNAMLAVALYIDTSGHYVPGLDLLNKGLNEVIRYKANLLFVGSELLSGSRVLSDLKNVGIIDTASATPEALSEYASSAHVNYTLLFTVRPLDVSLDIKAFSSSKNSLLIDKTITKPESMSSLSTLNALSTMIEDELTNLYNMVQAK
jgi:hypothetical protein